MSPYLRSSVARAQLKAASGIVLTMLLIGMLTSAFNIQQVMARMRVVEPKIEWQRCYGGSDNDWASSVRETDGGGYVVVGGTSANEFEGSDVYLFKTDVEGNLQWERIFGDSNGDWGSSVQQTGDGGYIVAGATDFYYAEPGWVNEYAYLVKTDIDGIIQWERTFGGGWDYFQSIQETSDGGFIVAGTTVALGKRVWHDPYLVKTDENGNLQWQKTFGGDGSDFGEYVQQTFDGGYMVIGSYSEIPEIGPEIVYLVKIDSSGNLQWEKTYGGWSHTCHGTSGQQTIEGGYIIAGTCLDGIYLVKTDSNGEVLWEKTFEGFSATSIQQTDDGGYIIAADNKLIRTDVDGNHLWEKTFEGFSANSVQQTGDGGYIVAGKYGDDVTDVKLIKLSAEIKCARACDSLGNPKDKFDITEEVFIVGNGFPASTDVTTYFIPDGEDALPASAVASVPATTDATGDLPVTLVWSPQLTIGEYDIWVDVNQNEVFDAGDVWNIQVFGIYGFFVIPEMLLGTLTALLSTLAALTLFIKRSAIAH